MHRLIPTRHSLPSIRYCGLTHTLCPAGCAVDMPTRLGSDKHAHGSPASFRVRHPCGVALELSLLADAAGAAGMAGVAGAAGVSVAGFAGDAGSAGVAAWGGGSGGVLG
jgi:hypothetical protein